jgi:hypothetical protein
MAVGSMLASEIITEERMFYNIVAMRKFRKRGEIKTTSVEKQESVIFIKQKLL